MSNRRGKRSAARRAVESVRSVADSESHAQANASVRVPTYIENMNCSATKHTRYLLNMTDDRRLEFTVWQLRVQMNWSVAKFLRNYALQESLFEYAPTRENKLRQLATAILEDEEVAKAIVSVADPNLPGFKIFAQAGLTKTNRELDEASKLAGFGKFDPNLDPQLHDLETMPARVKAAMPSAYSIISLLISSSTQSERAVQKAVLPFLAIVSIMCRSRHVINSGNFGTIMGIYLHTLGVKRRVISVLASFRFCASYDTIIRYINSLSTILAERFKQWAAGHRKQFFVCWDNIDYHDDVKHRTSREPGTFITATTGLVGLARDVPPEGIRRDEFNPKAPMTIKDIAFAPGVIQDEVEDQIRMHLMVEAIRYTHPDSVESIFKKADLEMPQFPVVERLEPSKTEFHKMGPINANEGTKSGCITVMDTIFKRLGIPQDDPVFQETIQLSYGDQKTVLLVQSVKKDRRTSKTPFATFSYMLSIPGLFHFRMNFMDLIFNLFAGEKGSEKSAASITENMRFMGIARGPTMPFHHKQEAAIRVFNARILAMFYDRIKSSCDLREYAKIEEHIRNMPHETFLGHLKDMSSEIYAREAQSPPPPPKQKAKGKKTAAPQEDDSEEPVNTTDYEFSAYARFLDLMILYLTLKKAIKLADIGVLKQCLARSAVIVNGTKKCNYAILTLYLSWLSLTDATSERLKRAFLANSLVNLHGEPDSWFEMDRLNEFINLRLKLTMRARRSSTESLEELFNRSATVAEYCAEIKKGVEKLSTVKIKSKHTDKDAKDDVYRLAYHLYREQIAVWKPCRSSLLQPSNYLKISSTKIGDNLANFLKSQSALPPDDDNEEGDRELDSDDLVGEDDETGLREILVTHDAGEMDD